ncbi:MAG: type IV pilus twitching motility protein PilT [Oscillospiraceae bacterium]|nr:type IV pilus twitching motility protein PilT [Oscillospiraceae bacterium]
MLLTEIVENARKLGCSDIHLTVGRPCLLRLNGRLLESPLQPEPSKTRELILSLCSEQQLEELQQGVDLDFAFQTPSGNRQRLNIFSSLGSLSASIRLLNDYIPTLDELRLPPILKRLADLPRGLVLVTGPTGSGKSTTLASMIDLINTNKRLHILTIEDPVEYLHRDKKSLVHQRELGRDMPSFASALRSALREDPDVILVGEMRDYETISAAVTAAETGHLVFSTLHTTGASQTIDRIVDACPPEAQHQMRSQLSTVLKGVVTQALLPTADGNGRIAATEILVGTDAVLNLIRESKTFQLPSIMQSGASVGMHTFDNCLTQLARSGAINRETALEWAFAPQDILL